MAKRVQFEAQRDRTILDKLEKKGHTRVKDNVY